MRCFGLSFPAAQKRIKRITPAADKNQTERDASIQIRRNFQLERIVRVRNEESDRHRHENEQSGHARAESKRDQKAAGEFGKCSQPSKKMRHRKIHRNQSVFQHGQSAAKKLLITMARHRQSHQHAQDQNSCASCSCSPVATVRHRSPCINDSSQVFRDLKAACCRPTSRSAFCRPIFRSLISERQLFAVRSAVM